MPLYHPLPLEGEGQGEGRVSKARPQFNVLQHTQQRGSKRHLSQKSNKEN